MNNENKTDFAYLESDYAKGLTQLGRELSAMRVGSRAQFKPTAYGPGNFFKKVERVEDLLGAQFDIHSGQMGDVILMRVS